MEFLARVTAHIPNKHQVMTRYYGYSANRVRGARRRREQLAVGPPPVADPVPLPLREARRRWAELLRQIFEVDPLRCPQCGAAMRIVAFITQRAVIDRILDHLRRARDSARGPPKTQPSPPQHGPDDDGDESVTLHRRRTAHACDSGGDSSSYPFGLYAPCMVLISLLGMNVKAAFPIMMGSCAFLMPVASARFARTGAFDLRASLGLALGGLPAVAIAAWLVKELPLDVPRWLVVGVVPWTAASLLWTAQRERIRAAAR